MNENNPDRSLSEEITDQNWLPWLESGVPFFHSLEVTGVIREYIRISLQKRPVWSTDDYPETLEMGEIARKVFGDDSRESRQKVWQLMRDHRKSNVSHRDATPTKALILAEYYWPNVERILTHNANVKKARDRI